MNRHTTASIAAVALALAALFPSASLAQRRPGDRPPPPPRDAPPPPEGEGPPPPEDGGPRRPPPLGPTFNFVASEMRFDGPPVKERPFAATAVTETSLTLADGTKINRKSTGMLARDREGRARREIEIAAIGPFVPPGAPPRVVIIDDPVAEAHYSLDPQRKVARRLSPPPPGERPDRVATSSSAAKVEQLGKRTIEGFEAEGTRSTITIPAGQIGNDRPLEIVTERWYSPDLKAVLRSTHRDPRTGETVYYLTNVTRGEPDRSLFAVPPDYEVERDEGGPPRRRPGGRRPLDD